MRKPSLGASLFAIFGTAIISMFLLVLIETGSTIAALVILVRTILILLVLIIIFIAMLLIGDKLFK